jgi:hypothetical protein
MIENAWSPLILTILIPALLRPVAIAAIVSVFMSIPPVTLNKIY